MVPVERSAERRHGALGVGAERFEAGDEAFVMAQLLGRDLAEPLALGLGGGGVGFGAGPFIRLEFAVRDGSENLDEGFIHGFLVSFPKPVLWGRSHS